ncbi:MAG: ISAs1 family transposase [Bdellovibrionaceae bacterium]|nr:ISAs1 family transposase [Pseudobdellovibrionaceae bacterium]
MKKDFLKSPLVLAFSKVPDPRVLNRCKYKLIEIIGIVVCGVLCGCETWLEIEEFSIEREDWFSKFFALEDGLPSHDTLARCFSLIEPSFFEQAFREWVKSLKGMKGTKTIAIDGKAVSGTQRSFNSGTYPLYLLNVFCHETGLTLSQKKASGPGHGEIFAAEECLDQLVLKGTIVTMDAGLGVNRIAQKIRDRGGDYLLPLKKNQRHSLKFIEKKFETPFKKVSRTESNEISHGREEMRRCQVLPVSTEDNSYLKNWPGLKTAIKVERRRTILKTNKTTTRVDYYISSCQLNSSEALETVRSHWSIENKLHWNLDVAFREDSWKVREKVAAENLSLASKICMNLLEQTPGKQSKKVKMKKAGWNPDYLENILMNSSF